jgi:hypothetical protein
MSALRGAWDRFWFTPASTETLGVVRAAIGFTFVLKMIGTWGLYRGWDGLKLRLPHHEKLAHGAFRLPVPGFEWLPPLDAATLAQGEALVLGLAVLFTVGLFTRLAGALLTGCIAYWLLISQWNYLHHVNTYVWIFALLTLGPCGDHFSADALLRRGLARLRGQPAPAPPVRPVLHQRMLQVFIAILYITTTIGKLTPAWIDGTFMGSLAAQGWLKGPWKSALLQTVPPSVMGWWTLFAEGLLGIGLWHPKSRRVAAWCGVTLHLGIDLVMNVTTFSYLMISSYLAFADPRMGANRLEINRSRPAQGALRLLVPLLDWGRRLRVVEGEQGLRFVPGDGSRARVGADALAAVLGLLPATFLVGLWVDLGSGAWARRRPA